ncbi:MAG: hypothetical protein HY673_07960 [Chloroflexi bacterium]|nr:hypothetical protein [Chloroflexota bacterium]
MRQEKGFEAFLKQESIFPKRRSTPIPGGYMGKVLRVDLSSGKLTDLNLPEDRILRQYMGGQGLAQLIILHELPSGANPLDPENPLVVMAGPLTGNGKTPAGTVVTVTAFNNITRFLDGSVGAITSGIAAGYFGSQLKFAGYDGIIFNGVSEKPVYLWIKNGRAEIRDGSGVWGKDAYETQDIIRKETGEPGAEVMSIGPAGENMVPSALAATGPNHSCSHGAGAVFGSKKLKAIGVFGSRKVPVKNMEKLTEAGNQWRGKMKVYNYPQDRFGAGYPDVLKTIVHKNFQTSVFPEVTKELNQQEYTPRPCYECNRQCPYDVRITTGKHAGYKATVNGGSEQLEAFYTLGIGGPDVYYLADVINRAGIDGCHFGCGAGLAFEAYEKGLITKSQTDGLELKWGDVAVAEKLVHMTAKKEGWLGRLLAEGPKDLAEAIGPEAKKMVVHIKGGAPALHDWRPYTTQMLGQMTTTGGGKPRFQGFEIGPWPELGYTQRTLNQESKEGKARESFVGGLFRIASGCAGVCWFGESGVTVNHTVEALAAITGWDVTKDEVMAMGDRTWQMEHIFHIRHGWTPEEDMTNIGQRFLEPLPDGPFKGFGVAKWLPDLFLDFYKECGWDPKTGKPLKSTLQRLNLEEFDFLAASQ